MNSEERSAIKFCVLNGLSKSKAIEMIGNAYGKNVSKEKEV